MINFWKGWKGVQNSCQTLSYLMLLLGYETRFLFLQPGSSQSKTNTRLSKNFLYYGSCRIDTSCWLSIEMTKNRYTETKMVQR